MMAAIDGRRCRCGRPAGHTHRPDCPTWTPAHTSRRSAVADAFWVVAVAAAAVFTVVVLVVWGARP